MTNQTYRRARHSVSLLHAHLVFVTKYRRKVFTDAMLTYCETTMREVCDDLGAELVEFNGEANHAHLLVAYPPTLAISTLVQRLKGRTAYAVRRELNHPGFDAHLLSREGCLHHAEQVRRRVQGP
ncbi:IS200/IS605 family transposase, partial [Mycobacterium sp. shizuoka-1]|uniref:IS200/IS605 family transposase n=1 Tax=Mycobacterium sp. shizuoka-1 TaxID=2039281 RepID=UPI001E446043